MQEDQKHFDRRPRRAAAVRSLSPALCVLRDVLGAVWIAFSFWSLELFIRYFIPTEQSYGLLISLGWSLAIAAGLLLFPKTAARILYAVGYGALALFAAAQAACHQIIGHMIWLSDIAHAGEGAEYQGTILGGLSAAFWCGMALLLLIGVIGVFLMPRFRRRWYWRCAMVLAVGASLFFARSMLAKCIHYDADSIREQADTEVFRLTTTNYGIYTTLYNAEEAFTVCGYYQLLEQDVEKHTIQPLLPSYQETLRVKKAEADAFYDQRPAHTDNDMTGVFAGKNVILVLMETMDDFLVTPEDTPTICRLMDEGINFTNFYTPVYSSIHTFNTEFCVNAGYYLPTSGKSALYYTENDFSESLPNLFRSLGYRANAFHYNTPVFYNRGAVLPAIGFEAYNCYEDYLSDSDPLALHDEAFYLHNDTLRELALGGGTPFYDYIITRNAHTPFTYDDEGGIEALKLHPEYRGKYESETLDVIRCKVRVVDDMFAELLEQLEAYGELENTVIVGFTDHYAYPVDQTLVQQLSGVDNTYLEMRTPCFIWSYGMTPMTVDKTLNTADLAPTLVNLFGIESDFRYLGQDAFDENYAGYAVFSDGSWLAGDVLYSAGAVLEELSNGAAEKLDVAAMNETAQAFIRASDAMIETDYYAKEDKPS